MLESLKQPLRFHWRTLVNVLACILAFSGLLQLISNGLGQAAIRPFTPLQNEKLLALRYETTTRQITDDNSAEEHWQALQPALGILSAINPEITQWFSDMNTRKRIIWTKQPTLFNWPVLASYIWYRDEFYLGPDFWQLPEGEKVAVIAHEYYHHRQSKLAMIADTVTETLSGKLSEYGSRTEDEAHLYQLFAYRAMQMPPTGIVVSYFISRPSLRFLLPPLYFPGRDDKKPLHKN